MELEALLIDEKEGAFSCEMTTVKKEGSKSYSFRNVRFLSHSLGEYTYLGPSSGTWDDLWKEVSLPGSLLCRFPFRPVLIVGRKGKLNLSKLFPVLKMAYYAKTGVEADCIATQTNLEVLHRRKKQELSFDFQSSLLEDEEEEGSGNDLEDGEEYDPDTDVEEPKEEEIEEEEEEEMSVSEVESDSNVSLDMSDIEIGDADVDDWD